MVMEGGANEALRKSTESMLRAVLISAPNGIQLSRVEKEYQEITMQSLPYRDLGFSSLLDFMQDLKSVARVERLPDGQVLVKAIPSTADQHVAKLVEGQKKSKKKSTGTGYRRKAATYKTSAQTKPTKRPAYMRTAVRMFSPSIGRYLPSEVHGFARGTFNQPPVAGKQLYNKSPNVPSSQTRHLPPRMTKLQQQQQAQLGTEVMLNQRKGEVPSGSTSPHNVPIEKDLTPEDKLRVRGHVRKLLENVPSGLWDFVLKTKYKSISGEEPPPNLFGIIVAEMQDMVVITRPMEGKAILSLKKESQRLGTPQKETNTISAKGGSNGVAQDQNGKVKVVDGIEHDIVIAEDISQDDWNGQMVVVCHHETISRFYVHNTKSETKFVELVEQMQEFYNGESGKKYIMSSVRIGMYCCAQYTEDNMWCRAKVLSVCKNRNGQSPLMDKTQGKCLKSATSDKKSDDTSLIRVFYMDYGNHELLQMPRIRRLKEEFTKLPAQAALCQIGKIIPKTEGSWGEEEIQFFKNLTQEKYLMLNVIEQDGNQLNVDLEDKDGTIVSKELVQKGHAVYLPPYAPNVTKEINREINSSPPQKRVESQEQKYKMIGQYVEFPKDPFVDVFVSNINSPSDFSIVLDGRDYYERLETLEKSMLEYYADTKQGQATNVSSGGFYAVYSVDGWYRAKALNVSGEKVDVLFVDHGDKCTASIADVRSLPPAFIRLPFQAISCALYGISTDDTDVVSKFKQLADGKLFVASVVDRGDKILLELIDTSSDEDKSINEELLLLNPEANNLSPSLPKAKDDVRMEAYLVYISDEGVLHLQVPGAGYDQLQQIMEQATERFSKGSKAADFVASPVVGTICFARASEYGTWYRAKIVNILLMERKVEVEFVDYGDREIVSSTSLREPSAVTSTALTLPYQVVKCRLADWPDDQKTSWKDGLADQLMNHLNERAVWVQTVKDATRNSLATVNLYRTRDDGSVEERTVTEELLGPFEINSNLDQLSDKTPSDPRGVFEDEKAAESVSSTKSSPSISRRMSSTSEPDQSLARQLSMPVIRTAEEGGDDLLRLVPDLVFPEHWIDVTVVYHESPSKFVIQLLSAHSELDKLHQEMDEYYKGSLASLTPPAQHHLCAVCKTDDGIWYRAIVLSSGLEDKVCIKYVDYGDVDLVSLSQVRNLEPRFYTLAFQAIRATLAGIKAKTQTWTSDCLRRFSELITGKVLVAKLLRNDLTYEKLTGERIRVTLYDTTDSAKDVIINDQLIADGFATIDSA